MNGTTRELVEDLWEALRDAGDPHSLGRPVLRVAQALHAVGEERGAGVLQVKPTAVEFHQVIDDVGGGHALGADGGRESLAELAIGDRGESVHAFWHITGFFGLSADTLRALRGAECVARRRAHEARSASVVARARCGQRRGCQRASASRQETCQQQSTRRCSFVRTAKSWDGARTSPHKGTCTECPLWSLSAAAPWVKNRGSSSDSSPNRCGFERRRAGRRRAPARLAAFRAGRGRATPTDRSHFVFASTARPLATVRTASSAERHQRYRPCPEIPSQPLGRS